jgi:hypothetical protein
VVGRNTGWATAWQPSPAGQPACAVTSRRPRAGRHGGVLTGGSAVARWRQGVAGDLEGVTGKVPGKEERTGAHRNGGSTVRRCQRRRAVVFISGEGAPVVAGGGDEVLQLGRGKGVRDLQEISGIGSSGRSSPGSGRQWWCSAGIHEGVGAADGRRRWSGCGERWGSSGVREKESERSGDGRTSGAARAGSEWLSGTATEGKEEGKDGGPGRGGATRRGGAVGPDPYQRTAPGPPPGPYHRTEWGREAPDGWAAAQCRAAVPLTGGAGLSAGAVESAGARGPAREESGVAEPR